ncbi:class I SAM-dependent methyltransferase [Thiocystis violacea]|uniref:class I SAM-dependent methyltransferase n=1 Tax=Thiocystis violacea TaxID=13725 RepID=UPI001906AD9E|nr:class I SAM-dependent methyltransferase [Thiocystis violacea]MBK1717473.1 hypothetical protein [Thiocystis violacea]
MMRPFLLSLMMIGLIAQPLAAAEQALEVPLPGKRSIVRLGAIPNPATDSDREIAQILFDGLDKKDPALVSQAIGRLETSPDDKNVGGGRSAILWLARQWVRANGAIGDDAGQRPKLEQAYLDFFLADDGKHLKEYLQRKYRAADFTPDDPEFHLERVTFLDDLLLFNNPSRTQWDATDEVVRIIAELKPEVNRVIDLGAGFGYFSQRIAEALGPEAIVHAADTQETYVEQLRTFVDRYGIAGIRPVVSKADDILIKEPTDLVFIASLYHVLYAWSQPRERDAFMETLHKTLRNGGYLVILDNRDHDGVSLHNTFLNKEFAQAQLYHYGFELVKSEDLSPYRYILVLRKTAPESPRPPQFTAPKGAASIRVSDSNSVVHIGSLDSFDITSSGISAAKLMMKAISESDPEVARSAVRLYEAIIPNENFGGEYTALQWVAEYIAGTEEEKKALTKDPLAAEFLAYLAKDDFANLKFYVTRKYKLDKSKLSAEEAMDEKTREIGIIRRQSLEDFILFNNPRRENWEQSSRIMERLPLKPGDRVVDLGSGPGYFSFKFAERVGPSGTVHAMDTKDSHIEYIKELTAKWGVDNLVATVSATDGFEIPEPGTADMVFMCSLYHILYAVSSQAERDGMIASIIKALKPGGRFVIVDNGPVAEDTLPYHGPHIRQELITAQLEAYGFKLESTEQIIPQRYVMTFSHGADGN